jgi:beta-galactosidase
MSQYPSIFGSQYYRAPTPEPECWAADMARMRELGFSAVKLFVQWRWSHRAPDRLYFDDLDRLMDLAGQNQLAVTLNTLLDMSPLWLFDRYPDARQISNAGEVIEPYAVGHRSIGGHPGPCYNHPGALEERKRFMAAVFDHFRGHPALSAWDVWNEPEQSFQSRVPDVRTLVCYCPHCRAGFANWLQAKYGTVERLNEVWGRCYEGWGQVELPRTSGAILDFVDWREFHLDTMTAEAAWRLSMAREHDLLHPCYLHVVPNVMTCFSSVTGVDDFALAEHCDLFAASMNGTPPTLAQVVSAARGKTVYNVESHLNYGSLAMHQRRLGLQDVVADFVPQIGAGVRGFLFWQYRPETLGMEAPAWGIVKPDGSDRPITGAVAQFWAAVGPHAKALLAGRAEQPAIGIWKSRRNEVLHFAMHGSLAALVQSVEAYIEALYWRSYPFRIISERMLAEGNLGGLRWLILPSPYGLTEGEAGALDRFLKAGGVVLCEAHLGGYNLTTGRHSRTVPGCGLAEAWGLREADSTSSYHLRLAERVAFDGAMPDDVRKALEAFGTSGGPFFPIRLADHHFAWGGSRYAALEGAGLTTEGSFDGAETCIGWQQVGQGHVLYCGTNLGEGAARGNDGLLRLVAACCAKAGITPTLGASAGTPGTVHVDLLGAAGGPQFLAVTSRADRAQALRLRGTGRWRGLFSGLEWALDGETDVQMPARLADLFVPE